MGQRGALEFASGWRPGDSGQQPSPVYERLAVGSRYALQLYELDLLRQDRGLADYVGGEYGCVGSGDSITAISESGYIATATAANSFTAGQMVVISGFTSAAAPYNNSGYPVMVLPQGLSSSQFEYVVPLHPGLGASSGGTASPVGSVLVTSGTDSIGLTSCGSTKIASALSALNTAWSTSYTTFGTTDAAGLAGIANNTYTSTTWSAGTSTGLLDENGTNIINSTTLGSCGTNLPAYSTTHTWGKTAQLQLDLNQFIGLYAAMHLEQLYVGYHSVCGSTCPPLSNLFYDAQNETYQQGSPLVDVMTINPFYYADIATTVTRVQTILNSNSGIPLIEKTIGNVHQLQDARGHGSAPAISPAVERTMPRIMAMSML